jgi:hypothetical protein
MAEKALKEALGLSQKICLSHRLSALTRMEKLSESSEVEFSVTNSYSYLYFYWIFYVISYDL